MKLGLLNLVVCFLISIIIAPFVIKQLQKLKFGQNILIYVEKHKSKSGTPTMGGLIFILSASVGYLIFFRENNIFATISILSLLFFGVLGFLDDFIKIRYKQNEGLKPYQKVIGQVGISIIIAVYIYMSDMVGVTSFIPFSNQTFELGYFIIPFVVFMYLAIVNSVNLIDGLDGLCGGVSSIVISVLSIVIIIISSLFEGVYLNELNNLVIVSFGLVGALFGFLCFNTYPARVFMGDTGSLALGGFIASMVCLTRNYLLIAIVGIMFVLTTISVILQVSYFKMTRKRIFKMSPLHHHFEQNTHEAKVVSLYNIVTMIVGLLTISMYL